MYTWYAPAQQNVADVVKQSSDAVVLIVISDTTGDETALGSGFLVTGDGEIVTNYHVIKDAHSAVAKLANGAFFPVAGVLAYDKERDLAIVKVNGRNLPSLQLADTDKARVGDHVVAIGSPLGLEGTVSDGIVSAFREVDNQKWIQTTAPVSHGNSGGPLLDMNNHVLGVITWGVNLELGENLNFAAPSSEVKTLLTSAHQDPKPLAEVGAKTDVSFTSGKLWTSINTGHDYNLRQDGDYLYVDWVNVPDELKKAGGFVRSELKKLSDAKWQGKTHAKIPCTYTTGIGAFAQKITNWCSYNVDIEIDAWSERRIEGLGTGWKKFNCKKCEPEGKEQKPFTWIPK
jgi:S1-C subfamily serine protease